MPSPPVLDKNVNHSPHVVILGAGASVASFPNGDANSKRLPLMNDLVEVVGLQRVLKAAGINTPGANFEAMYDELHSSGKHPDVVKEIERRVYDYFASMRLPQEPTMYDYLVLSLREKDLIASFNWDPLLIQAYARNVHIAKPPSIAFLHGNFGVGVCLEHSRCGYPEQCCLVCGKRFNPCRLLYPVKHKDYSADPFIADEWNELRNHLSWAYFVTIYGYSAPVTDVDARTLMLDVWKKNPSLELAEIEIIDVKPQDELRRTWGEFFVRHHYCICRDVFDSYLFRHPRRSCEAFASATLMMKPWMNNPFPRFQTLKDLQSWVQPLIEGENRYNQKKEPFSEEPCPELSDGIV